MTEEQIAAVEYEEAERAFTNRERAIRFREFVASGGLANMMADKSDRSVFANKEWDR